MIHKWKMRDSPCFDCGHSLQSISHILSDSPLRAFNGTVEELHKRTNIAVKWIRSLGIQLLTPQLIENMEKLHITFILKFNIFIVV